MLFASLSRHTCITSTQAYLYRMRICTCVRKRRWERRERDSLTDFLCRNQRRMERGLATSVTNLWPNLALLNVSYSPLYSTYSVHVTQSLFRV